MSEALDPKLASRLDEIRAEHARLGQQLESPEVLRDHTKVRALSIKRAALDPIVDAYTRYTSMLAARAALDEDLSAEDPELAQLARDEAASLDERIPQAAENIKKLLVSSDDAAIGSVILEIRAGTGGDEAGLWARDLLSVYTRFAATRGWNVEELELDADPSVGGVRHAVLNVSGEQVWTCLSFESGVHSVKRVPQTENQGRIHTSTCSVVVLPEPEDVDVQIDWANDVNEHITTAQGPGGQNVNKVATAVHLIHEPTGIEVRMQESKSQLANKEKARRLLVARVHDHEQAKLSAERDESRRAQIGSSSRSEKIRVYRYQDNIVADSRLSEKLSKTQIIDNADLTPMFDALIEQQTAQRLAAL